MTKILDLEAAIRAVNHNAKSWSQEQGCHVDNVYKMIRGGCIVIDGVVYRPTKYKVRV